MVSIIIPNYNKSEFLRKSLDSVLAQTAADWEAICVDDCSADGSQEILKEYVGRDPRLRIVFLDKNRGGNYARNRGAAESRGEYLIFLDSDDALYLDCVERRVEEFERPENSGMDMLVFKQEYMRNGRPLGSTFFCDAKRDALLGFLRHDLPWQTMMAIWKREAFERIGGFNEKFPRMQDVEIYARALLKGLSYRVAQRATPDCLYSVDENRQTADNVRFYKTSAYVTNLFSEEMSELIKNYDPKTGNRAYSKAILYAAIDETRWCAIRGICDAMQGGRLPAEIGDSLCEEIVGHGRSASILRFYIKCCRLGINRLKGFNYSYRRLMRIFI